MSIVYGYAVPVFYPMGKPKTLLKIGNLGEKGKLCGSGINTSDWSETDLKHCLRWFGQSLRKMRYEVLWLMEW